MTKLCGDIKRNGEACRSPGNYPDGKCFAHSEANAAERSAGSAKGGKRSRVSADLQKYRARVVEISEGVLSGKISRGNASVAIAGYGVAAKLAETTLKARQLEESELVLTQLKIEEQRELVQRLEQLEERLALEKSSSAAGGRPWAG